MAQESAMVGGKFSCAACGKQYAWKPQLAGRKAKCSCGAAVVVPTSPVDDEVYDVAAAPVAPTASRPTSGWQTDSVPLPVQSIPVLHPPAAIGRTTMGYAVPRAPPASTARPRRDRSQEPLNSLRDIHIPVALVIGGFFGILAWAFVGYGTGPFGPLFMAMAAGLSSAVKTAIVVAVAVVAAPMFGVSLGDYRTAAARLASVLVFTDACLLWLDVVLERLVTPASAPAMRGLSLCVSLFVRAALVAVLVRYLFDFDLEETGIVALPTALAAMIVGLVVKGIIIVAAAIFMASRGKGLPPAPGAPPKLAAAPAARSGAAAAAEEESDEDEGDAGGPAATTVTGQLTPDEESARTKRSAQDREIGARVRRGLGVQEGRAWMISQTKAEPRRERLVALLYNAGARKVYFDVTAGGRLRPTRAFVELPDDPGGRAECFRVYQTYCRGAKIDPDPESLKDAGQRFMVMELKK